MHLSIRHIKFCRLLQNNSTGQCSAIQCAVYSRGRPVLGVSQWQYYTPQYHTVSHYAQYSSQGTAGEGPPLGLTLKLPG